MMWLLQVEGAFAMGLGMMLSEEVRVDPVTGASLSNSTWTYKVPGISCTPRTLNVHLLRDSPLHLEVGGPSTLHPAPSPPPPPSGCSPEPLGVPRTVRPPPPALSSPSPPPGCCSAVLLRAC